MLPIHQCNIQYFYADFLSIDNDCDFVKISLYIWDVYKNIWAIFDVTVTLHIVEIDIDFKTYYFYEK